MKSLTLPIAYSVFVLLSMALFESAHAQQDAQTGKRAQHYALLVGVNDYSPPLGKLEFCLHDMQELSAHFGYRLS